MISKGQNIVVVILVVIVLVLAVLTWHLIHKPVNPLTHSDAQNVIDFDQFQQDLATRVMTQLAAGSDFSVIVATAEYPLGTLLRATGSVPADVEDCAPSPPPKPYSAQRLFPSYTMSRDTAVTANLGSRAMQGLENAGVSMHHSENVQYTIADTRILMMDDKSIEQVTGQGSCGKYISAHPGMRLIRGAVTGKMTFIVKVANPASVKAQLAKIGGFSVSDDPESSTLQIADQQDGPIVQLLSEFRGGLSPSAIRTAPPPAAAPPPIDRAPASVPRGGPHMFVQMDVQDNASSGAKVVQLLQTEWPTANVESRVERIPTQKMPDTAQVRYFNESDADIANKCAAILRRDYPTARVMRIGLLSPPGQLEVWLPKIKPATAQPPIVLK